MAARGIMSRPKTWRRGCDRAPPIPFTRPARLGKGMGGARSQPRRHVLGRLMIPRAAIASQLAEAGYVADRDLSTALWMMDHLSRPLLIEGEAGVGKTEVAKALAKVHGCEL